MKWKVFSIFLMLIITLCLSGCIDNEFVYESKKTHVCYGVLIDMFVDGTMASIELQNGSCKGITFYPSPNEGYESFDFELLEIGSMYTFVFHLEDNVPRPGIDLYYLDDCPVIDEISRGNQFEYWIDNGCVEW